MIEGIYIYTEIQNGKPAEYTSELVTYAESLKLEVPIRVFGLQGNTVFYEAEAAKTIAAYLQKESPGIVLNCKSNFCEDGSAARCRYECRLYRTLC